MKMLMDEALPRTRRWALPASVFLVSFTALAFEVSLTRVFSVLFRYHYAFLAVSGAVSGLGIGAFAWHLVARRERPPSVISGLALAFALLIPGSVTLLFRTPLADMMAASLWTAFIPVLPFVFAGAFLAEVFRQRAEESGRLYHADLAGAAVAAILIVPLIGLSGALHLAFLLGGLGAMGAACGAAFYRNRALTWAGLGVGLSLLICWPLAARNDWLQLRPLRGGSTEVVKPMLRDLADPALHARIIDSDWSAYARTDLVRYGSPQSSVIALQIFSDGETPTPMIPFHGDLKAVKYLGAEIQVLAFGLAPRESLLSIGPGGGVDFLLGALTGFKRMDGVEINASLVRMMERHRRINGNIYHRPGVKVTVDDGRSFVRRSQRKYDLIIASLTQTATSGNIGLALVESYIHTQEAFADYSDHLTPNGRFALVTQSGPLILRAAFTAIQVMRDQGVSPSEACRHLLVLAVPPARMSTTPYRYLLVWKKTPVAAAEIAPVLQVVRAGLVQAVFIPGVGGHYLLQQVAAGQANPDDIFSVGLEEGGTRLNLRPATDERPFFLDLSFGVPGVLKALLIGSFGVAVLYNAILLWRRRRAARAVRSWLVYFSALGVGFMLVEIPLAQKFILFLGHPTLSLAAIIFYLLIGASLGSRLSQRWPVDEIRRRATTACLVICFLVGVYALFLSRGLNLFLSWPLAARLALPTLFLVPLGIALGVPFPSGLRMMSVSNRRDVPWMLGTNGLMSVVGSTLAAAGAKLIGFNGCLLCAAAIYVGVALCLRLPGLAEHAASD